MILAAVIGTIAAVLGGWVAFERWRNNKVKQAMAIAGSTAKAELEQAEAESAERIAIDKSVAEDAALKKAAEDGKRSGLAAVLDDRPIK